MDFKNKQQDKQPRFNSRNTQGNRNLSTNRNPLNANPLANAFASSNINQNNKNSSSQPKQSTGGLNRFKKVPTKGAAPKGQFKKYLSQANNVFYEDRWQLKQLQKIKLFKWGLFFFWFFLALTYFIIGRIQPYDGVCPQKATCGVFVHCPDLFQYYIDKNQCKLSSDFIREFQVFAHSKIQKLQVDYGWQQCKQDENGIPKFNVNDLLNELEEQEKIEYYRTAANNFFNSKKNQQDYGFEFDRRGNIIPTRRQYTLSCSFIIIVTNSSSFFNLFCLIIGILVIGYITYRILQSRKYSKMYQYLRDRVFEAQDKTLNVTHTLTDLQTTFGPMNETVWNKINDLRANDKKIGYYQDDFLYWKAT